MITVILVVYKTDPFKLKRIIKLVGKKYKIIIIDNSFNYNFNKLDLHKNIKIIRSNNIGNGAGINLGIKYSKTPYVLYLDTDTKFDNKLIPKLILNAKKIKKFGIICPNNGKFSTTKKIIENYNFEAPMMLFNIKNLKKIGFFDEKIFLYFEETDLFFRCKKNNQKVYIITNLILQHERATSISKQEDLENKILLIRRWNYMWSMFYYYQKNFNYFYGIKKTFPYLCKDLIMILVYVLIANKEKLLIRFNQILGLLTSYLLIKSYNRLP